MKKYIVAMLFALLSTGVLFSCKKSSTPVSTPKDYAASIKDKTWWGVMTYTGQALQYYSVHFYADNSLFWSQIDGDYLGQWTINNKQLAITFTISNVQNES